MVRKKHAYVEELEARLVRDIRYGRAASRLELATRHKLAPSTIGIYVDRLIANGHLSEESVGRSLQPGRPAQKLTLRKEAGCFVGVEFEARNIHAVCVDFSGTVIRRLQTTIPVGATAEDVLAGLQRSIDSVLEDCYRGLLGVGVGVPGLVDVENGIARHYRFIEGWTDIAIARRLRERFKVPILLENSSRAMANGVMLFEQARRLDNFICLLVRSGVGAGIVVNGALHRGVANLSGEVGRISLFQAEGEKGEYATVEDVASLTAILRFVREGARNHPASSLIPLLPDLDINAVISAAREGDALARESIRRAIGKLGWLAHMLALVENPKMVVLCSPLNALGDWLRMELQASVVEYSSASHMERPGLHLSELGADAGALGAASLAMDAWKPLIER